MAVNFEAVADSFMAGMLAFEAASRSELGGRRGYLETSTAGRKLVDRMVQLFSWYLIEKLLSRPTDKDRRGRCSEAEQSIALWKQVLQGGFDEGTYLKGSSVH